MSGASASKTKSVSEGSSKVKVTMYFNQEHRFEHPQILVDLVLAVFDFDL